jgi:hypothetical protein
MPTDPKAPKRIVGHPGSTAIYRTATGWIVDIVEGPRMVTRLEIKDDGAVHCISPQNTPALPAPLQTKPLEWACPWCGSLNIYKSQTTVVPETGHLQCWKCQAWADVSLLPGATLATTGKNGENL